MHLYYITLIDTDCKFGSLWVPSGSQEFMFDVPQTSCALLVYKQSLSCCWKRIFSTETPLICWCGLLVRCEPGLGGLLRRKRPKDRTVRPWNMLFGRGVKSCDMCRSECVEDLVVENVRSKAFKQRLSFIEAHQDVFWQKVDLSGNLQGREVTVKC